MLKNLPIKTRLVVLVVFLGAQLLVGSLIGVVSLKSANARMESMYQDRLVRLGEFDQIIRFLNRNQLAIAKSLSADQAETARDLEEVEDNRQKIESLWTQYLASNLTNEEKALAERFAETRKEFVEKALMPAVAAVRSGEKEKATALVHGPLNELFLPVRGAMNDAIKLQLDMANQEFRLSQDVYRTVRNSCIAALLLGLGLAAAVSIWVVRSIAGPLNEAVRLADRVAAGDLTQKITVESQNEMGRLLQSLSHMNDSLLNIVLQVRDSTETIGGASTQIASGNLNLSARTEQQASALEETASSMEELTSIVRQNEESARQANSLAMSASEVASKGGDVVSQVVATMGDINDSARKIVDIISVIDGIAFQTNILALNAAVEAARAGEQGRGFAVVASEVRSLAQRSAGAAKEIKALIANSVERADTGSRLVEEAGATMNEVVKSIRRVTDIMAEITAATREQTAGIEQVNRAIVQMDDGTQQNAALVEEAAAAAASMQDQAMQLAQVVSVFKLGERFAALPAGAQKPPAATLSQTPRPTGRRASRAGTLTSA